MNRHGLLKRWFSMKGRGQTAGIKVDGMPRFYKKVMISYENDSYHVKLDDKTVRTPLRQKVQFDNKLLATAIAHEWDAQHEDGIRPKTMPLMTFASTCLDDLDNPDEAIEDVLKYLQSDTICFEAPEDQRKLRDEQTRAWKPIRDWIEKEFGGPLGVNKGTLERLQHSPVAIDNIAAFLNQLNRPELLAVRAITRDCKSLAIALALFKRRITVQDAIDASRIEEEHQITAWGLVEGGHDLDRVNCRASVASASSFLWLHQSI